MPLSDIPANIPDDRVFVCVGHGSLNFITDKDKLTFTVPDKVWIVFWVHDGETLAGKAIEEYRSNLEKVDPRTMRGENPDLQGFAPRVNANRRLAGVIAPEVRQSVASAAAAATQQEIHTANQFPAGGRRRAWGPRELGSALDNAGQRGAAAGEIAAMRQELATNRGILLPVTEPDSRSARCDPIHGLPEVLSPGQACPSYRLTYDPMLCYDYLSVPKNKFNAEGMPAFLLADHRIPPDSPISERGRPLETFARLLANKVAPAVLHWAACRAHNRER